MRRFCGLTLLLVWMAAPCAARACAACYGQSDSPIAVGMNWGIMSLLGILAGVLAAVVGFFVYIGVRASSQHPAAPVDRPTLQD